MNAPLLSAFLRRAVLCACLGLSLFALASRAGAADLLKFTAPEVNDYVKKQSDYMDAFIAALKDEDDEKKAAVKKEMGAHADKNMFTVYEKLTDAEKPIYDKWVKAETDRMGKAILEKRAE